MFNGLITAMRTLTIFPVPGKDARNLAAALPWFPLVGGLLGLTLYAIAAAGDRLLGGDWPGGVAAMVLAGSAILTRGLHLDGLADWADGFGGAFDRERTLEIMKDSFIGAFGIIALILIFLIKWAAIFRLVTCDSFIWILAAYIVSRTMQVELAVRLPYARGEGGTAAPFVGDAKQVHRVVALSLGSALLLAIFGLIGLVTIVIGLLTTGFFGLWCKRRLGGVTGDLLGACSEFTETIILFSCAAAGQNLISLTGWSNFIR
jgi:adenosylcobinamide-GDP ribazoletransferase